MQHIMDFKIDTKDNYSIITPEYHILNDILAEKLMEEVKLLHQDGALNIIIDFENIDTSESNARNYLLEIHKHVYEHEGSLVFTGLNDVLLKSVKKDQLHINLNITPTMIEAKDIINMEDLERTLFNEPE